MQKLITYCFIYFVKLKKNITFASKLKLMERKDYYKILGLSDSDKKLQGDEFKKKVKQNYKKNALKYHPDRQHGKSDEEKKAAEEKFKELAEAYEVLSDDTKRSQYDNPMGGMNFDFGGFGNFDDIMNGFDPFGFGLNGRGNSQKVQKGQSIRITIGATLEELYNGVTKQIKYKKQTKCSDCNGSGMANGSKKETCSHCGGTGQLFSQNGGWQTITTCPYCGGKGTIITNPCKSCGGSGLVEKSTTVEISIPKNVQDGTQLVMRGQGGDAPNGGVNGDLLVVVREIKHNKFIRQGNDLYFQLDVPILDALLGGSVIVETIDGKQLTTKLQQGVSDGFKIRFSGKGMPHQDSNSKYGDMYGVVNLKLPTKLDENEINVLKSLKGKGNFK